MRRAASKMGRIPSSESDQVLPKKSANYLQSQHHVLKSKLFIDDMWLNISSLVRFGQGPEKTMESDIVFIYGQISSINFGGLAVIRCRFHRHEYQSTNNWVSLVTSNSLSLASNTAIKLFLLHVPVTLKEAELNIWHTEQEITEWEGEREAIDNCEHNWDKLGQQKYTTRKTQ